VGAALQPEELHFFSTLATAPSMSAAARELNVSTAAVSKKLAAMERRLGVGLIVRTTRRMSLTPEGQVYLQHARRILADLSEMEQAVSGARVTARGLLRVNATLGFGRSHVAPVIARFARQHPQVEVQLQLTVNPPPLTENAFDVCIRFGEPPDARVIAKFLAANRRLLVASPGYLARRGTPKVPRDLMQHNCIGIRQGDEAFGLWRLVRGGSAASGRSDVVKTRGTLTTNDGEIAVNWALEGHGVVMRAEWDIGRYLRSGRLVQVLADYRTPAADIYAVYPRQLQTTARVRTFVDFIAASFAAPGRRR
jgi:DNA-binding transcriptional LysR family regulator